MLTGENKFKTTEDMRDTCEHSDILTALMLDLEYCFFNQNLSPLERDKKIQAIEIEIIKTKSLCQCKGANT